MKIKVLTEWIDKKMKNYNAFIPEEDDYEDEDDAPNDPVIVLKHQRYATRLYTIVFIVLIYVLSLIALMNPELRVVTISNITPSLFNQLRLEHGETLSCPCSNSNVPYKKFVSNSIKHHPVCSSIFVSEEWITALYDPMASRYLIMDFRTTAHAQFKFLAEFCSLSRDIVSQTLTDLGDTQFVSIQILSEYDVRAEVKKTIELALSSSSIQIIPPLQLFQIIIQSDSMASALNTNVLIKITYVISKSLSVDRTTATYIEKYSYSDTKFTRTCDFIDTDTVTPAGFYSEPFDIIARYHDEWPMSPPLFRPIATSTVDGFFGGCTALGAVLASTLDCLYKIPCLETFTNYFPGLSHMNLNWTNSVLSSSRKLIPLHERLVDLLVENLSTEINYLNYFYECAPSDCTYTTTSQMNFFNAITLLLSLYGGLVIVLRFIAPLLINLLSKLKHRSRNTNFHFVYCIRQLGKYIGKLNFFKTANDRTPKTIRQQRISTRVYMLFLAVSIVILVLFTSFNKETITTTESSPSLAKYEELQAAYPNTIKCPCSNSTNRYKAFVSFHHTFHQVCSSDFVNDSWIWMLAHTFNRPWIFDWQQTAALRFLLLSNLCQLAKTTIDDAVQRLAERSFITSDILTESAFNAQLNTTLTQFTQSIIMQFDIIINTMHLFILVDQPHTKSANSEVKHSSIIYNNGSREPTQLGLYFTQFPKLDSTEIPCVCVTDFDCQSSMILGAFDGSTYDPTTVYTVPGAIQGCFTIDSVLLSTLECFYSSECLSKIVHIVNSSLAMNLNISKIPYFNPRLLIYDPTKSRFTPQTPFSMIVKEMMIEEWNQTFPFRKYYEACAPNYCRYSYEANTEGFIGVIIKLVSTIGGLVAALRFITYQLVKLVFRLFEPKVQRQPRDRPNILDRIKITFRKIPSLLYGILTNLNIFPLRIFGSTTDRLRAKYLGQLTTRLYIVFLIIGLAILILYSIVQPRLITKSLKEPSFEVYNRLMDDHSDTLRCPCTVISSIYDQYVTIKPIFHQICTSSFVSDEWRKNLTSRLLPDLNFPKDSQRDYRRFLSAHLQFLTGLCNQSIKSVNASVYQFLSSLLVTPELLSQADFHNRIHSLIEQSKVNAPRMFTRLLRLLRNTNHGNAIISTYGTNFEYIDPLYSESPYSVYTKAINYDRCTCDLNATCTIQATFFDAQSSSKMVPIMGLKMGCTPTESFLASTLACFYNSSCINLIHKQLNYNNNIDMPLLMNTSRFTMDTPVIDLVNELFIENWSITINYSSYFDQCSVSLCSYTYIEQINLFYTVSIVSGLYGGLSFSLQWFCPIIIRLLFKLNECRKKRRNRMVPVSTIEMVNNERVEVLMRHSHSPTTNTNSVVPMSTTASNTFSTLLSLFLYRIFPCILIASAIIIPSVYLHQRNNHGIHH